MTCYNFDLIYKIPLYYYTSWLLLQGKLDPSIIIILACVSLEYFMSCLKSCSSPRV